MIIHCTTVHLRTDTRIRVKQVATLARHWPGKVSLYVQDGLGDEREGLNGFVIHDTGPRYKFRLLRMTLGAFRMYCAIRLARPHIVHFHDPELLPWAILLRLRGAKVIYDMHEDLPKQIMHKDYLTPKLSRLLSPIVNSAERLGAKFFDRLIVVVPAVQLRFNNDKTILLANFPSLIEFPELVLPLLSRTPKRFIYVGAITAVRGIFEMTEAISLISDGGASLHLLGAFADDALERKVRERGALHRVDFHGWCSRETVTKELYKSSAGLVLLHPTPQHLICYPVKMFEYMAAGLPVIASDFPLLREIIQSARCGLLVDPQNPQAIADAMQWIIDNPEEASAMGCRGRAAIEERFNWEAESEKLLNLYQQLID